MGRHVVKDNRVCSDNRAVSDLDRSEYFGSGADKDIIADDGNFIVAAAPANGDLMRNLAVFPDDAPAMDDDSHAVVVERRVSADCCRAGHGGAEEEAKEVIDQFGEDRDVPVVEGMPTLIEGKDLAHVPEWSKTCAREEVATKSTKGTKR
jgi:hypothetical protein